MHPLSLLREPANFSFVARGPLAPFVSSLAVDRRLAAVDIVGTLAHVAVLKAAGLLTDGEATNLAAALRTCLREVEAGTFPWDESLEDVHTNLEARLDALAPEVGSKVHAGRSRNDQVALDERLYLRLAIEDLLGKVASLERALLDKAKEAGGTIVPAYTHLRKAQPILLAHALLAHLWRLVRDADRLFDAFGRVNVSPAGAGAVAGTSLPLDAHFAARLLGFERAFANSIDATSDRDYFVEATSDLALLAVHLGGLAEDLILWSAPEFGFVALAPDHVAGSSLLPNKRNPDILELIRGQTAAAIGDLTALLVLLKGLSLGYQRDLQWDKASASHAIDASSAGLEALTAVVSGMTVHADLAGAGLGPAEAGILLVEHLVARGVAYREAYEAVKARLPAIVAAEDNEARLAALRAASPVFDESSLALFEPAAAVSAIVSHGGTGPAQVSAQVEEAAAALGRQGYHLTLIAKKNRRISDVLSGEAGS